MRIRIVSIIGFFIFFVFLSSSWADEVLLKNGNVLEGKVVQEYSKSIIFSTLDGKGKISINRDEIKSIEKKPLSKKEIFSSEESEGLPRNPQVQTAPQIKPETLLKLESGSMNFSKLISSMGSLVIVFLLAIICIIAFIVFIAISKKRPFVIRIICFFGILSSIIGILSGLTMIPFLANIEGFSLYFVIMIILGMPLITLIIYFNLFYLRRWARIGFIFFLGLLIIIGAADLLFRKNIIYEYSRKYAQQAMSDLWVGEDGKELSLQNQQKPFNWVGSLLGEGIVILIFLYLLRAKTKEFFSLSSQGTTNLPAAERIDSFDRYSVRRMPYQKGEKNDETAISAASRPKNKLVISKKGWGITAIILIILFFIGDRAYQRFWTDLSKNPSFFKRPVKIRIEESVNRRKQEIMDASDYKKVDFAGLSFYLPQGLERQKLNSSGNAVFLDRKQKRSVVMSVMPLKLYNIRYISEYARWNPMLLIMKILGSTPYDKEIIVIKEIKFSQGKGIFKVCKKDSVEGYKTSTYWGSVKDQGVNFIIMGKEGDDFTSENNILGMLSAVE